MKITNKLLGILTIIFCFYFTTCATTKGSADELSLLEAIEQSAERIAAELPAGSRVAIVAFETESDNLSEFIIVELSGALRDRKIGIVERQSLEYVRRELDFQMSGDVSDESTQSIGKFMGAQLVIIGQLRNLGSTYRFTANAIMVEQAENTAIPRFTVRNDRDMKSMIATLNRQSSAGQTAIIEHIIPHTAGAFLDRGILFAARGDFQLAIADFTEAIRMTPNLVGAYIMRGRALIASLANDNLRSEANFSEIILDGWKVSKKEATPVIVMAFADFTHAIRLDQNNAIAYRERGRAHLYMGDKDSAISDFNQAIHFNPNYAGAYHDRGEIYGQYRQPFDYIQAITDFTQALRINPNFVSAYINRGMAFDNTGDYNRAIADYTQALRLDTNYTDVYFLRASSYYDKEDYDRAIADCTQALRIAPDKYLYRLRGDAYYMKSDYNRAITDYEAALQIDPNYTLARYGLEEARQSRGR